MVYKQSEENVKNTIQRSRIILTIQYSIPAGIILYLLLSGWYDLEMWTKVFFIIAILFLPLAWFYFDRKLSSNLRRSYEVIEGNLIIKKNKFIKNKIPLQSIKHIKKLNLGFVIESYTGNKYIIGELEGEEDLLNELKVMNKI